MLGSIACRAQPAIDHMGSSVGSTVAWRCGVVLTFVGAAFVSGCTQIDVSPSPSASNELQMPESPITDRAVACMVDRGWPVERSWYGGYETYASVPDEQQSQYLAAEKECAEQSGFDTANESLTDAQIRQLYRQEVEEHECLTDLGLESYEPPSEQVYLDTYLTEDWYFAMQPAFDTLGSQRMIQVIAQCPPPTYFLNLDGL